MRSIRLELHNHFRTFASLAETVFSKLSFEASWINKTVCFPGIIQPKAAGVSRTDKWLLWLHENSLLPLFLSRKGPVTCKARLPPPFTIILCLFSKRKLSLSGNSFLLCWFFPRMEGPPGQYSKGKYYCWFWESDWLVSQSILLQIRCLPLLCFQSSWWIYSSLYLLNNWKLDFVC